MQGVPFSNRLKRYSLDRLNFVYFAVIGKWFCFQLFYVLNNFILVMINNSEINSLWIIFSKLSVPKLIQLLLDYFPPNKCFVCMLPIWHIQLFSYLINMQSVKSFFICLKMLPAC